MTAKCPTGYEMTLNVNNVPCDNKNGKLDIIGHGKRFTNYTNALIPQPESHTSENAQKDGIRKGTNVIESNYQNAQKDL